MQFHQLTQLDPDYYLVLVISQHFPTPYLLILIGAEDHTDDLYVSSLALALLLLELLLLLVPVVLLLLLLPLLLLLEVPPQGRVEQRFLVPWAAGKEPPGLILVGAHWDWEVASGPVGCLVMTVHLSAHPNQTAVCNVRYLLDVCLFVFLSSLLC